MAVGVGLALRKRMNRAQADAFRHLARQLDLSPEVKAHLDNALYHATVDHDRQPWEPFSMFNNAQAKLLLQAIKATDRPHLNLLVWHVAITELDPNTGFIQRSRAELAKEAGVSPREISMAMSALARIGAIIQERHGRTVRYRANARIVWNGGEGSRQEAAKSAPALRLVDATAEEAQ